MSVVQRVVTGSSGAPLSVSHTPVDPAKPGLLIALPFGVPASVADAAIETFAPGFNVVTWETRYILAADHEFGGDEKFAPSEHVQDMLCMLRELGLETCCLIGYCSGAGISLLAAREHPEVFTELLLVNGEYQLFKHKGHAITDYERSIDAFLPIVATGRKQAKLIFAKMAEISKVSRAKEQTKLDELINRPFDTEESLFRYAKNYMAYRDYDALAIAAQIRQPTFVLSGQKDEHCNIENSEAIHAAIGGSKLFVDDNGDHYEFCRAGSATLREIAAHLGLEVSA